MILDLYSILLLHPAMKDFDVKRNAFAVSRNASEAEIIKKEEEDRKFKISKYQTDMLEVKKNIIELDNLYEAKLIEKNNKFKEYVKGLATEAFLMETMNLKIETHDLQEQYANETKRLENKYAEIQNKVYELNNLRFDIGFTTPKETKEKFDLILFETREYVKKIADLKGISVVINSSSKHMKKNIQSFDRQYLPNYTIELFSMKLAKSEYRDEEGVLGHYETINDYVHSWLEHGNFVINNMNDCIKDCDIIIGGVDLTSEVLAALYRDYKIDKNLANSIIQSVLRY